MLSPTWQIVDHQRSLDQAMSLQLWIAWAEQRLLKVPVDQGHLSYSAWQVALVRLQIDQQEVLSLAPERPLDWK